MLMQYLQLLPNLDYLDQKQSYVVSVYFMKRTDRFNEYSSKKL